jgi:hypothetical protein
VLPSSARASLLQLIIDQLRIDASCKYASLIV